MRVDQFDFELPEACIALRPAEPRHSARLLIAGPSGEIEDAHVCDMVERLEPGDVVVFNDTRVIPAELHGVRKRGSLKARIQVTLHNRIDGANWRAFARPAKKLKVGDQVSFGDDGNTCFSGRLDAAITGKHLGGEVTLAFDIGDTYLNDAIQAIGHIPLPPYIASRRSHTDADKTDYQTIYARHDGAVAAPTAGLHFDTEMLSALNARGIEHMFVTLHVGAGTFLPVKVDDTNDHRMHAEWGEVTAEVAARLNKVRADGGRIVAVGTTSLRLLESAVNENGVFAEHRDDTDIFITPGYEFRAVDILLTNFHLPRSTLFMLVSAFSGLEPMRAAYRHAIDAGYRFYSYGDACLLYRREVGT